MTRDEVIKLAREAGFVTGSWDIGVGYGTTPIVQSVGSSFMVELERFAELVAAAERDAIKRSIKSSLGEKMASLGVDHLINLIESDKKLRDL